ncbi:MAG: type IV toxin-antitoxin system AbiEi family antitoxin domain-containing protein [Myxococcota bacterium]
MMTFFHEPSIVRRRALEEQGLSWRQIQRFVDEGELERVGRGLYVWTSACASQHRTLAEAAVRVPHGVVCLLSALSFHRLGSQVPHSVWMAVKRGARRPRVDWPPLEVVQISGKAWGYGVEPHEIEGVSVCMTSPPKTVADCFKFRSTVGLDVALEGLRDYLGRRDRNIDELFEAADACRMRRVMLPYVESLA